MFAIFHLRTVSLCHLQKVSWCQVSPTELLKIDCARPTLPCTFIPATGAGDLETVWRAELCWAQVTFITSSESLPQQFPGWRHWRHRPGDKAPVCAGCGDDGGHRPLTFLNWPRKPGASGSPAQPSHHLVVSQLIAQSKHTAAFFVC